MIRITIILFPIYIYQSIIFDMQFREDAVSDFILYKLNNPQALEKEMKLIEDRKEYMRKLEEYGKQMQTLRDELSSHNNILDTLTSRRTYLQENFSEDMQRLDKQIQEKKEKLEQIKKETKEKKNSSGSYIKKYDQFQKDIVIKKQKLIENHDQQLMRLDQQTEQLRKIKEDKKERKAHLLEELKKLKERQKIIMGSMENIEKIKNKWQIRDHEFQECKEQEALKAKQIDELVRNSKSMEKVIYSNLYKRVGDVVNEMIASLDSLYGNENFEMKEVNWEENLEQMFSKLKGNREKILLFLKSKRERYKISPSLPDPNPQDYNYIVQTKINPQFLVTIDSSNYTISNAMYIFIEEGQNSLLDDLQNQKLRCDKNEKEVKAEILNLRKRLNDFEEQIQIKRRGILSPPKKRK